MRGGRRLDDCLYAWCMYRGRCWRCVEFARWHNLGLEIIVGAIFGKGDIIIEQSSFAFYR